jgi:hypothetical protein
MIAGSRHLESRPDDLLALKLVGLGALLSRLPCNLQEALLPGNDSAWIAALPPAAEPHLASILETIAGFAVADFRRQWIRMHAWKQGAPEKCCESENNQIDYDSHW